MELQFKARNYVARIIINLTVIITFILAFYLNTREAYAMSAFHEFVHSYDLYRGYTVMVSKADFMIALTKDQDLYGTPLNETFENLVSYILSNSNSLKVQTATIEKFLTVHDDYDLTLYTSKTKYQILAEKVAVDNFADSFTVAVSSPSVKDLTKLAAVKIVNPIDYIAPVVLESEYLYAIKLNNWLDAASYICKNIHYDSGIPQDWTIEEQKTMIKTMLNRFPKYRGYTYPESIEVDVNNMFAVRDHIISIIDSTDVKTIGDYIDANVPKLPLIRRLWAK